MRVSGRCIGLAAMLAVLLPAPVAAQFYQCVAYAREATGMSIRGNANTWWGQAEGLYERGTAPRPGAIMAFHASRSMPMGHVAVVAEIAAAPLMLGAWRTSVWATVGNAAVLRARIAVERLALVATND